MGLIFVIAAPALFSLVSAGRDLYCDADLIRTVTLRAELSPLREGLLRRAGRLEHYLERESKQEGARQAAEMLKTDRDQLAKHLGSSRLTTEEEAYWALLDSQGMVIEHSDSSFNGKRLTSAWDDFKQADLGNDVVKLREAALLGDREAYDVSLPIYWAGEQIGTLHSGLDAQAVDQRVRNEQRAFLGRRSGMMVLLFAVNAAAIGGLVYFASRFRGLRSDLISQRDVDARKLTQIGYGLAHEIRNPLHALRLNTHTLRRSLAGKTLSEAEMTEMMRESCDEIDRIENLMRSLVQYVSPRSQETPAELELNREAQAILQLHGDELRRRGIEVQFHADKSLLAVRVQPSQMRTLLHELVTFAVRSAKEGGVIEVRLRPVGGEAELVISDQGRPLSPKDLEGLFEPFHATPYSDAGLSLALIRQFVIQCGGTLVREQTSEFNRFVLRLPLIQQK
jgi:signal transduction histidine kinase